MTANKFEISIVLVFAIASASCTNLANITQVGKLLIDTDIGGDDAVALLMALGAEKFYDNGLKIIGVTCVNGNTVVDQVALNALKTLKVADRLDIPVYLGASHPLLLPSKSDYFFGQDGFGDFYYPDPPSVDLIQSKHAVNAMIDLVKAHPGEMTLLALGPLTNVALAIRMYPPFLNELQQLIVMGGNVEGRRNSRSGIQFNFFIDPIANYIVFNASTSKPVILMPYETNQRTLVTMEFRMSLNQSNNNNVWLIDSVAGTRSLNPRPQYWTCADGLTAAVALTSGSIVTKAGTYYSEAIYDGSKTAGMIIVDYTNITGKAANTNLIQGIDVEVWKQLLLRYFNSR